MGVPMILPHPHPPFAHMLPAGSSYNPTGSHERQGSTTPRGTAATPPAPALAPARPDAARGDDAAYPFAPPIAGDLVRQQAQLRAHGTIRVRRRVTSSATHRDLRYASLAGQPMAVYRRHKRVYERGMLFGVGALGGGGDVAVGEPEAAAAAAREEDEEEGLSDGSGGSSASDGLGDANVVVAPASRVVAAAAAFVRPLGSVGGVRHVSRRSEPGTFLMRYDSGEEEPLVLSREVWRVLDPRSGATVYEHVPVGEDEMDDESFDEDDGEEDDSWVM